MFKIGVWILFLYKIGIHSYGWWQHFHKAKKLYLGHFQCRFYPYWHQLLRSYDKFFHIYIIDISCCCFLILHSLFPCLARKVNSLLTLHVNIKTHSRTSSAESLILNVTLSMVRTLSSSSYCIITVLCFYNFVHMIHSFLQHSSTMGWMSGPILKNSMMCFQGFRCLSCGDSLGVRIVRFPGNSQTEKNCLGNLQL